MQRLFLHDLQARRLHTLSREKTPPQTPLSPLFHTSQPEFYTLGRAKTCDVCLDAPYISRLHAIIEKNSIGYVLKNRSHNGTRVNDHLIESHPLKTNDLIEIGSRRLRFTFEEPDLSQGPDCKNPPHASCTLIGKSAALQKVLRHCRKAAECDLPILLQGQTGTGKSLLAQYIHEQSGRSKQQFLVLNCATLAPTLIESELFGHERGAFTGAVQRQAGIFVSAQKGTLFLDEVNEIPLYLQAKLLRALEEKKIRPVGMNTDTAIDVRVIAASNRSLYEEMRSGKFREDLYHRLNVIPITIPSLSERQEDLPELAVFVLKAAGLEKPLTNEALERLRDYSWPGNIREFRNVLVRAALFSKHFEIRAADLIYPQAIEPQPIDTTRAVAENIAEVKGLKLREAEIIHEILQKNQWNRQRSARLLGISRSTLQRKIRKYGFESRKN